MHHIEPQPWSSVSILKATACQTPIEYNIPRIFSYKLAATSLGLSRSAMLGDTFSSKSNQTRQASALPTNKTSRVSISRMLQSPSSASAVRPVGGATM